MAASWRIQNDLAQGQEDCEWDGRSFGESLCDCAEPEGNREAGLRLDLHRKAVGQTACCGRSEARKSDEKWYWVEIR